MSSRITTLFPILLLAVCATSAQADRLAPSVVTLTEAAPDRYDVLFKTPTQAPGGVLPELRTPADCLRDASQPAVREDNALVRRFQIDCQSSVAGRRIGVDGLAGSGTATVLRVVWRDGARFETLLTDDRAAVTIPTRGASARGFVDYLRFGSVHIVRGLDHLLFVVALVLLVPRPRRLVWTVTAFTVGHSITLGAATLGWLSYPPMLMELAIALSLLVMAVALARDARRRVAARFGTWAALGFGLLHGTGFASALGQVGLPPGEVVGALLGFNLGIEFGQLAIIGVLLTLRNAGRMLARGRSNAPLSAIRWTTVYAIGSLAAFWSIERAVLLL